jgi:ribonuclease Z
MKVTILGCYAGTPLVDAHPTSQVLEMGNHLFLIDCGEGTQLQLRRNKIKFSRIKHIFISHLHGDHFFGLPGLISTFRLLGRDADLHIYGPKGIKKGILLLLKLGDTYTNFNLFFHELKSTTPQLIFEDEKLTVTTIPLKHRVYTNGFLFKEKLGERILNKEATEQAQIETCYYQNIKKGKDVPNKQGEIIKNALVSLPPKPVKSYAFCSDTMYFSEIVNQIKGVTALYHESTFLEEHAHLCEKTKHSTAKQAATIAKSASVKNLILGHFSTRYDDTQKFKEEAQTIFKPIFIAADNLVFEF